MDTLFHFLFLIIAALATRIHVKHGIATVFVLGLITALMDVDHLILGFERTLFHNVFITIFFPAVLIVIAFLLRTSFYFKGFSVMLLLFLSSHLFLDVFTSPGVAIFYPLSDKYHVIDFSISIPIASRFVSEGYIISSAGIGLLLFTIIILLPCLFLDEIIEIMERKHENFRKAIRDLMKR